MTPREIATLRGKARTRVIADVKLSLGARVLYFALDDWARIEGKTQLLKQPQIAKFLGVSAHSITEWCKELDGRHVRLRRGARGVEFTLLWSAKTEDQNASDLQKLQRKPAKTEDHIYIEYSSETPLRQNADDFTVSEAVDHVIECLRDYPGALRAIGTAPSETVARQCLDLAEWNISALAGALEWLHKSKRGKPQRAWAWFPVVLGDYFDSRRRA